LGAYGSPPRPRSPAATPPPGAGAGAGDTCAQTHAARRQRCRRAPARAGARERPGSRGAQARGRGPAPHLPLRGFRGWLARADSLPALSSTPPPPLRGKNDAADLGPSRQLRQPRSNGVAIKRAPLREARPRVHPADEGRRKKGGGGRQQHNDGEDRPCARQRRAGRHAQELQYGSVPPHINSWGGTGVASGLAVRECALVF